MTIRLEPKRVDEVRRYRHDWTPFLGTDTIASHVTSITGATLNSTTVEAGNRSVIFAVSGGTGAIATISHRIVTAGGDTESEVFQLPIFVDEIVSLAEAKRHLRVEADDDDALILSYIRSARAYIESESGFIFLRRQLTDTFDAWGGWLEIHKRPVVSVDAVTYTDDAGATQPFVDYWQAAGRRPLRIYPESGASWPTLGSGGVISVTYTAGFSEVEMTEETELARQAILLLVGHWYANRESVNVGNITTELHFAVRALIDRFRTMVL